MIKLCKDMPEVRRLSELESGDWMLMQEAVDFLGVTTEDAVRAQIRKGRLVALKLNKGLVLNRRSLEMYKRARDRGDYRGGGRPRKER